MIFISKYMAERFFLFLFLFPFFFFLLNLLVEEFMAVFMNLLINGLFEFLLPSKSLGCLILQLILPQEQSVLKFI